MRKGILGKGGRWVGKLTTQRDEVGDEEKLEKRGRKKEKQKNKKNNVLIIRYAANGISEPSAAGLRGQQ